MIARHYTIPQVALALQVSTATVWRRILDGTWPSLKIGRSRRISEADLSRILAACQNEGKVPQV